MSKLVIPELFMPAEFSQLERSGEVILRAPFDGPAEDSAYPELEALQVGRPKEEIPDCTPHEIAVRIMAQEALEFARTDGEPFTIAWAGDTRSKEVFGATSALHITAGPGSMWNRPVRSYEQLAYVELVRKLSSFALTAQDRQ